MGDANPFAALSLIVAPAILTNASSVLAMSTSNRLARAADRARELAKQLEDAHAGAAAADSSRRLSELSAVEQRTLMLVGALRSFYVALGAFAAATLVSLLGAVLVRLAGPAILALEIAALVAGLVAVGALVHGAVLLVRETRLAVYVLRERAAAVRARMSA
ncbi:MAG TPA: DUF2721 domain-containing protein [Thermoanaerobaculia bacterium]|nr:DUF2721 domain-containing protein [Thermoanaerobaculia bacterium]